MNKFIFNKVKQLVPKISSTELIALRSGNTSIDRSILNGDIEYPTKKNIPNKLAESKLNTLFSIHDKSKLYPNSDNNKIISWLATNKIFSFIIDEKYGGNKLSVNELSNVLTKITSFDPGLGVVAMVPNSLGPGELISIYGTEKQKNHYLPKLATGDFIPCFGLTGPKNGSDATGKIDSGKIILKENKKYVEVEINKRYITLAPVANLMGLAFNLKDPNRLLDEGSEGITVALVERNTCGLIQETHHNPLNAGFPNGTLKGSLLIPVENIIGGEKNAGNGWKMLMECLSAGRGICLPATANASSKAASFGMYHYIKIREQFNMPLEKMEAIQEKFNKIILDTWIIQSSVLMTNDILDNGDSPAVISAIMKQQSTERARNVLNQAMDIHAGASICLGYSNFLEKFYRSAPIGITVEGSNTLTRSLIIFGQGLNKSHPYIFPVLNDILNNDANSFKENFNEILNHSILLYFKSFSFSFSKTLEQQVVNFACLTNFVALKGGSIKKEQMLSGTMADIFSNLYLAQSVLYYQKDKKASEKLTKYIVNYLINENQKLINEVVDNLGFEKYLLLHLKKSVKSINYKEEKDIFNEIMKNPNIIDCIKENIHIEGVFKDMEDALLLDKNSEEYKILKDKIINVGEYNN